MFRRWWKEYTIDNKTAPEPQEHNPAVLSTQEVRRLDGLLEKQPELNL